jgi:hypothetical protein
MAKVIAGVCDDCGAAAPHAAVHIGWHEQLEALLQRMPTSVGAKVAPDRAGGMRSGFGQGSYIPSRVPQEEYEVKADFIAPHPTEPARASFEDNSPEAIREAQEALAHLAPRGEGMDR